MSFPTRILGLDLGRRRVGVAVTDELLVTAQPLPALEIRGIPDLLEKLALLIKDNGIKTIVLGRPTRLDGRDTHLTGFADKVKIRIEQELGLPVVMFDERFTSKIAQQATHAAGRDLKNNKKSLDSLSASIILSDYLKSHA